MVLSRGLIKEIEFFVEDIKTINASKDLEEAKVLLRQVLEEVKL